ncbi:helix-turn-helix transcriptional regulator [Lentzea nigeriaca]|uniref:helix-turn-helix transcriptional regulator n=1 Tax=Lentzea nigeriaca TaxID=1128665 RepID=UPI00195AC79C|nr:helix-turn-helix transcriptional regulator [Lentzea nigeriaca]MBM7858978.1 DNA-binding CsgD family transcriptional regulator [Lentzea nigeriaca]
MPSERLVAPAEVLAADVLDWMGQADHPPLTIIAGPSGVESRTAVDEIGRALAASTAEHGRRVRVVSLSYSEPGTGFDLMSQVPPLSVLRAAPGTLLLFKDTHRLPADSVGALEALVRQIAATGTRCVCAVALPLPPETRAAFLASFDRLRGDGLVRLVTLRPVPLPQIPDLVTSLIGAVPEPELRDALWLTTRGWPNVLTTALRIGRDHDLLTVVDRHAYLTAWRRQFRVVEDDELLADVRALGPTAWQVAKAIAVLGPLGAAAPGLVGDALGLTEAQVEAELAGLARAGVLRYARASSTWRFRVPLVGLSLESACGPYERRRLAQIAVTAVWQGTARWEQPHYLTDQLLSAGRLVDPERARSELLAAAGRAAWREADRSLSWLRAAAELTTCRAERVQIFLTHARTCLMCGEARQALESTGAVLREYVEEIPDDQVMAVCLLHLTALHESGEITTLERVAREGWWPWPGTDLQRAVGRAFALATLGRWRQTHDLLEEIRRDPDGALVESYVRSISPIISLWLGDATEFDHDVAELVTRVEAGEKPHDDLHTRTSVLVTLGELRRARGLLALSNRVHIRLTSACQATLAAAEGRATEALALTRKSIATGPNNGCDAEHTTMFHVAATLQLHRGKLSRALALVTTARDRTPALPHLLVLAEAAHERLYQRDLEARQMLETALRHAEEAGVVALTDPLWTALADIAVDLGERHLLPGYLERVETVAKRMGTEQAEVHRLTLRAVVDSDRDVADQAVALLRERAQPLELASGLERLVRFSVAAPELLLEAYTAAGELDALMFRAALRNLMRAHSIPVPGRQATVAENERLLAVLVADGLGNKQIATLLCASEKSVEGRLSRLFSRTGYRSRVELASAMLTGRFRE